MARIETVAVACHAMATRFEIVLHGENATALRAAGEEALQEIERLGSRLSLYRPDSEISRINACAAKEPVRVDARLFGLLQQAQRLHRETEGTFDITIAPLMRAWGFMGGTGKLADAADVASARERVGMQHVILDERNFTVQFDRPGVMLDLGSIGKGYALDEAADLLREAGITNAILHGGSSTVYALGTPPDAEAWHIALPHPAAAEQHKALGPGAPLANESIIATVALKDEALSVSGVWGKSFEANGRVYGHIIDPRTGEPAEGAAMAAICLPSAMETDALSTALLTQGEPGLQTVSRSRHGIRAMVATRRDNGEVVPTGIGIAINSQAHA